MSKNHITILSIFVDIVVSKGGNRELIHPRRCHSIPLLYSFEIIKLLEIIDSRLLSNQLQKFQSFVTTVRPSVRCQLFPLNDFFSRTTRPISTNLGRKHTWRMEIQICSNKGASPLWGPIRGRIRNIFINLQKIFFS